MKKMPEKEWWEDKTKKAVKNSEDNDFYVQVKVWVVKKGEKREKYKFLKGDKVLSIFEGPSSLPACLTRFDKVCYALSRTHCKKSLEKAK